MKKQEKRSNQRPVSNSRCQLLETGLQGLKSTKAFTLVELIVVITILAILGTIAFISLQGYSKDARDSVRISDISKIKTSLELFQLNAGKYPETTTPTIITYSGAIAWTQGTFGTTTYSNVEKLDKIPLDPVTDRQYVYSVTNTKQEYQLAGIMEGDEVTGLFNQTNAAGKTAMLKISGNYNGKLLKVSTGTTDYILAMPSIVTSSGITVENIVSGKLLAYNGYKNLPAQYAGLSYDVLGDSGINLINNSNLVVYSGSLATLSDTTQVGIDARKNMIIKLQNAYSGTAITSIGEIAQIINTQTTNTGAVEALGTTMVSNNLGGSITASSGGGTQTSTNSCATQPSYTHATFTVGTPTSAAQAYVKDATNCGYTCTDLYTGTNCEIAPPTGFLSNCTANGQIIYTDATGIEIGSVNNAGTTISGNPGALTCAGNITVCAGTNSGYTLQACNLGSTTVGITSTSYGNRYQFGRNDYASPIVGTISWGNDWKNGGGINGGSANDWGILDANKDMATWNNSNTTSQTSMQGPCGVGYHIPTKVEWVEIVAKGGWGSTLNMINTLKLPMAGYRYYNGVSMFDQGSKGTYWASSPYINNGYTMYFESAGITPYNNFERAYGFSIRCLKN